jgi:hypothetical protein
MALRLTTVQNPAAPQTLDTTAEYVKKPSLTCFAQCTYDFAIMRVIKGPELLHPLHE